VFDAELLAELPASVDPCGERGEFHTFVSASPGFVGEGVCRSIEVTVGEVVERDGFIYADLLPG
jgi:diphthamide synthase (EF-2-diphthine--ammonia ligase)